MRHQPLPDSANIHARYSFTPFRFKNPAIVTARLHCLSLIQRSLRRIQPSRSLNTLLHLASWKYPSQPVRYLLSRSIRSSSDTGLLRLSSCRMRVLSLTRLCGASLSHPERDSRYPRNLRRST
jgi:hypothetical protein